MDTSHILYERTESKVVYTSFPQIDDLCCIICEIDFIEVNESSKSNFHWQTMKCRLLIHLIPDIIASPVRGTERFIFVVSHKNFFQTGKLVQTLRNFKLVYQGVRPVTTELYKTCLLYTIQTKIAPLWNKVGEYLVQGKDFYDSIEGNAALKMDIIIEEREMYLQLHVVKVKISCIKLENYISSFELSQFLAASKGDIDLSHYKIPFIHVLPSLKKGKLLSVSKEIPAHCAFKEYDQLRRHWKNMYGYSLPKNKDGILYYTIKFPVPKTRIFTYPNLCITGPLNIIPNRNAEFIITQFLSDILIKLPTICGKQLQISRHIPFYEKSINTNSLCSIALKDKELNISACSTSNDPSSYKQLKSSIKCFTEPTKRKNVTSPSSLRAQLTTIHQIHNTSTYETAIKNSSSKAIKGNQNDVTEEPYARSTVTKDSNNDFTVSKEVSTSKYFKISKPDDTNEDETKQGNQQKNLTLKEKVSKSLSVKGNGESLCEMEKNVDIEAMAKSNRLHQVKNSVLSDWLKKHSIPHNSKDKKTDLINKILYHIRNTKILQQLRL